MLLLSRPMKKPTSYSEEQTQAANSHLLCSHAYMLELELLLRVEIQGNPDAWF